jgi:hypothetical protein
MTRGKRVAGKFVDAGQANVNNPALLALDEKNYIKELADKPIDCLISIGTGTPSVYASSAKVHRLAWVVKNLIAVAINTEDIVDEVARRTEL